MRVRMPYRKIFKKNEYAGLPDVTLRAEQFPISIEPARYRNC